MYEDVLKLREQGLGCRRIQRIIQEKYSEKLTQATISRWIRGIHSPLRGRIIPCVKFLQPSKELAYVIGVVMGDGSATKKTKRIKGYNAVRVMLTAKDKEFVEEFSRCLGAVLGKDPPKVHYIQSRQQYSTCIWNKTLFELLHKYRLGRIRRFVEHCEECKAAFLKDSSIQK